jgi:hypothetical protein
MTRQATTLALTLALLLFWRPAVAEGPVSLAGESVKMIIPTTADLLRNLK